ncbi:MAG: FtsQ-type POTRA domain-containing protein [Gammaproteobacteria bacterium]|nr:FtsQ-type POTRA domain-containing protein [Gammaproteobacteria bacterium]
MSILSNSLLGNRQQRNRRRIQNPSWEWPKINWRINVMVSSSVTVVLLFLGLLFFAFDQPITNVAIQGRFQRVSPLEIEKIVRTKLHNAGLVSVQLDDVKAAVKTLPWVDTVTVARVWPRGIEVGITEQVAFARWGARGLLNSRGTLFIKESEFIPPELPQLSGPSGAAEVVAQRYTAMQGRLIEGGLRLVALRLNERGSWEIDLDSGVSVRLGRRQVEERFARFVAAALKVVIERGTDVAYVDMRYTNGFAVGWRSAKRIASTSDLDENPEI